MSNKTFHICDPGKIARKMLYGDLRTDMYYDFVCETEDDFLLAELDTNAPYGPVSGISKWVIRVHPHRNAQVLAELIWEEMEWSEVLDDAIEPYDLDCVTTGWECIWIVKIQG
jgi:hypothetical protein